MRKDKYKLCVSRKARTITTFQFQFQPPANIIIYHLSRPAAMHDADVAAARNA